MRCILGKVAQVVEELVECAESADGLELLGQEERHELENRAREAIEHRPMIRNRGQAEIGTVVGAERGEIPGPSGEHRRSLPVKNGRDEAIEAARRWIELLILRKPVGEADGADALQPDRLDRWFQLNDPSGVVEVLERVVAHRGMRGRREL